MDLILWRHAEAFEAQADELDSLRNLTSKGQKQAKKMGAWLDRHLPANCRILCSPAVRCVQTAEALSRKYRIEPSLAPEGDPTTILGLSNWPDQREPVLLIGHQPTLGLIAARLMTGSEQAWTIRKGNAWWLSQQDKEGASGTYLRAVLSPEFAGK